MKINPQLKMRSSRMPHPRTRRRVSRNGWKPASILVPSDFSYAADRAVMHAVAFARQHRAQLALLHVVAPVIGPDLLFTSIRTDPSQMAKLSEQRLSRLARRMKIRPRHQAVRTGSAAEEILKYAGEIRADLIVIGSHGHGAMERMLIGGTAERVVRHAECPVLVIPPPDSKARPGPRSTRKEQPHDDQGKSR